MPLNHYGFFDKPFEISPDLKFLYETSSYKQTRETVWKGITGRKGLIVITGEVGTGKTMLIYSIMSMLPAQIKTVYIFHSTYNFKELLQQIYSDLGESPPIEGMNDFKNRILAYLGKLRAQGEILAVFIDEAQKLSDEVFRALFSLLDSEPWISGTFQIILVGQTEFEETLNDILLRYRPRISPLRVRINMLSMKESLGYIEHRLKRVGRSSLEIFSPQALSLITEKSKGIPRLINTLCDNALFVGNNKSLEKIDLDIIRKVIRNLDGPEEKSNVRRKVCKEAPPAQPGYRFSFKQGLLLFFGLALGVAILLWHTTFTDYLTKPRRPGSLITLTGKRENPSKGIKPQNETQKNSDRPFVILKDVPKPIQEKPLEMQVPINEAPSLRAIQVTEGTTLSMLALQYYGKFNESLLDLILFYNPAIENLDLILVDEKMQIPKLSEEALIIPGANQNYSIHLGTFSDSKKANPFNDHPALKGKKITVQTKNISLKRKWYRVEAGIFESKQEALGVIKNLHRKGLLPFF